MKRTLILLGLLLSMTQLNYSQSIIPVDFKTSKVHWESNMLFSFGGHEGTVDLSNGNLVADGKKIIGGYFTIDMNSMVNTDGNYSPDLIGHLKNEDFFNVKKFPTSSIVFTNVNYEGKWLVVQADLTIKGITKPIKFHAELNDDKTKFTTKFKIDRTDWDIMYGVKGNLDVKDYAISDAIAFKVDLSLKPVNYNPFSN